MLISLSEYKDRLRMYFLQKYDSLQNTTTTKKYLNGNIFELTIKE